jgi:drug/metabolite transporter (DMT)-like permease
MHDPLRLMATRQLLLATLLWGISFPTMRAINLVQAELLPGRSTFFFASLGVSYRFALSGLVMLVLCARTLRQLTGNELLHGLGLGLFSGIGIMLQMDGLAHTEASTSAFLTQCYCLILPVWVAARDRRWPPRRVLMGCALVVIGAGVLARVDLQNLNLGRGETETLLASLIFTGQILWLERPRFANCRIEHTTLVMFAVMALVCLPVALATTRHPGDWLQAYSVPATWGLLAILVVFCTLMAFLTMNRWQRHVGATLAGLIYCVEPVFASLFALFLPQWFGAWAGVSYPNESLTQHLLMGGGLIIAANALAQWQSGTQNMPGARVSKP